MPAFDGRERLIWAGKNPYPIGFLASGELLASGGAAVRIFSPEGTLLRVLRYGARGNFSFDEKRQRLLLSRSDGSLAVFERGRLRVLRRPHTLDGHWLWADRDYLIATARRSALVLDLDGRTIVRTSWRLRDGELDTGPVPRGSAFAYRLITPGRGGDRIASIYAVDARWSAPRLLLRHRIGPPPGCGPGSWLNWHGESLLYSTADGAVHVLHESARGPLDLTPVVSALPRKESPASWATVAWRSEFLP